MLTHILRIANEASGGHLEHAHGHAVADDLADGVLVLAPAVLQFASSRRTGCREEVDPQLDAAGSR